MLRSFKKLVSLVLVLALSLALSLPTFADENSDFRLKDSSTANNEILKDPDGTIHGPQIGVRNGKPVYKDLDTHVSPQEKAMIAKKEAMEKAHKKYMQNLISKEEYIAQLKKIGIDQSVIEAAERKAVAPNAASSESNYIGLDQQPQETVYWCGPATASEIIEARLGGSYSQSSLVSSLHCTGDGTPWYDGTYPMADTLNDRIGTGWYTNYGTQIDAGTFKDHVTSDIDANYGTAANAYEVYNGPHLVGHPNPAKNKPIFHWFAIYGYSAYGDTMRYADSVAGSPVSWADNVPEHADMDYQTLATIVDGRGIIW